jgi:hypothetical protein
MAEKRPTRFSPPPDHANDWKIELANVFRELATFLKAVREYAQSETATRRPK